jgi:hypothetical protein
MLYFKKSFPSGKCILWLSAIKFGYMLAVFMRFVADLLTSIANGIELTMVRHVLSTIN